MLTKLLILCLSFVVIGCAGMPGNVSVSKNNYDNTTSVELTPGWLNNDGLTRPLKIGMRRIVGRDKPTYLMIVRHDQIEHFSRTYPNLLIKVDGKEQKFTPIDNETECELSSGSDIAHCYQEYFVDRLFIDSLINANSVQVKLYLRTSFTEGEMKKSDDSFSQFRPGLIKFIKKVDELEL